MIYDQKYWDNIEYFKQIEFGAVDVAEHVNPKLVIALDHLRQIIKQPIIIHCAYELEGHTKRSKHYSGDAADWHANKGMLIKIFLEASRIKDFTGIGIYPYWKHPGLHTEVGGYGIRLIWLKKSNGVYTSNIDEIIQELRI